MASHDYTESAFFADSATVIVTAVKLFSIETCDLEIRKQIGRPIKGGPILSALVSPQSANRHDPFLGLCLGCGSRLRRRLRWKLEHSRFLTLKHVGEHQSLPVRKF
jgi:hypothetical protein